MKNTKKDKAVMAKADLLALAASKLKNVVLFPEKLENARKYLDKAKLKTA